MGTSHVAPSWGHTRLQQLPSHKGNSTQGRRQHCLIRRGDSCVQPADMCIENYHGACATGLSATDVHGGHCGPHSTTQAARSLQVECASGVHGRRTGKITHREGCKGQAVERRGLLKVQLLDSTHRERGKGGRVHGSRLRGALLPSQPQTARDLHSGG